MPHSFIRRLTEISPTSRQQLNRDHDALVKSLDPRKLGYSPKMSAIIGALLGHDYGVRDSRGGQFTGEFNVTSDGFVIASSTASESGAFIGTVRDFDCNLSRLMLDAHLTAQEAAEFSRILATRVHRF